LYNNGDLKSLENEVQGLYGELVAL